MFACWTIMLLFVLLICKLSDIIYKRRFVIVPLFISFAVKSVKSM